MQFEFIVRFIKGEKHMTMTAKQKQLLAQKKQAAYLKKKKKQQKRMLLIGACALAVVAIVIILIVALPSKKNAPDPIAQPTSVPTPEATLVPAPTQVPGLGITSSSNKFTSALPVYHCPEVTRNKIAITIDDCNEARNVQKIIDLAIRNGAKLTIFPIGNQLSSDVLKDALRNAYNAGFEIENHTMSHIYQDKLTDEEFFNEVYNQEKAIRNILGVDYKMNFLRLPGGNGEEDPRVHHYLNALGYKSIADWYYSGTDADIYYIYKRLKPGAIYLFHTTDEDYQKLKQFIPYAISQGYELVTLNNLVGYPENSAYQFGTLEAPEFTPFVYDEYIVMEKGMRATCIKYLQAELAELGYLPSGSVADGIFGAQTEQAVIAFQNRHGLEPTGKADLDTQALLFSENAQHAGFY